MVPARIHCELKLNSARAAPDHNETLSIAKNIHKEEYNVSGCVSTGGGRQIFRVEVSTDACIHWELAGI